MSTDNKQGNRKGRRILGWGLMILGSLCTLLGMLAGISFVVTYFPDTGWCPEGLCFAFFIFFVPLMVIGVPSLIFGIRIIRTGEKERGLI